MMSDLTTKVAAGIGVTLAAAISTIGIYLYLRANDEDDMTNLLRHHMSKFSRPRIKRLRVRNDAIGAVIGRGGETIRRIQQETKTRINFEEDVYPGNERYAIISGTESAIAAAEAEILKIVNAQPSLLTNEIFIPHSAAGAVIGRNGDRINSLCARTGAKITVEKNVAQPLDSYALVTIKGTVAQIKEAKTAITDLVGKNSVRSDRPDVSSSVSRITSPSSVSSNGKVHQNGSSTHTSGNSSPSKVPPKTDSSDMQINMKHVDSSNSFKTNNSDGSESPVSSESSSYTTPMWDDQLCEELTPTVDDMVHVYVSQVESPSRFWVQLYGPKSTALDKLSNDMTEYYEKNCRKEKVTSLHVGDIVAAPFTTHDQTWYRVRVLDIIDRHPLDESDVKVYYLDFGGICTQKRKTLCSLKNEFLTALTFQAVECSLAGVLPVNDNQWSDEANDYFGEISHASDWIEILARPYAKCHSSESKGVPVDLFDFKERKERLNLATIMIEKGFARPSEAKNDTDT